tara:strand:+ start:657 stop:833 length:177 start_codon:yes stop_codon:yes gene_type:complete
MINVIKNIFMCPKKRRKLALEQAKKQWNHVKYETINQGDLMDYDGMGDWGRFPPIKKG